MLSSVLAVLADGQFHSGSEIGRVLSVQRASVWKTIERLRQLGVTIDAVTGKGYRLNRSIELLDLDQIKGFLDDENHAWQVECVEVTGSTHLDLSARARERECVPVIRFAEAQTEGKGRSGRQWITPYASQLACSILYPFDALPHGLSGLSLVVGLAAVDALAHSGIEGVMLKWPNDLFFEHQKLGGILIEVQGDPTSSCRCVISLGINCYAGSSSHVTARIDQPWIDCESLSGKVFSRNQLAGRLLSSLFSKIGRFAKQGLAPFLNEWRQHDMLLGQKVVMQVGDRRLEGVGKGVAVNGAFLLQTAEDTIELHSGEARLVKSIGNG